MRLVDMYINPRAKHTSKAGAHIGYEAEILFPFEHLWRPSIFCKVPHDCTRILHIMDKQPCVSTLSVLVCS